MLEWNFINYTLLSHNYSKKLGKNFLLRYKKANNCAEKEKAKTSE